jgi:hypothetical protein
MSGLDSVKKLVVEFGEDCGGVDEFALFKIGDYTYVVVKTFGWFDVLKLFPRYRIYRATSSDIANALTKLVGEFEAETPKK